MKPAAPSACFNLVSCGRYLHQFELINTMVFRSFECTRAQKRCYEHDVEISHPTLSKPVYHHHITRRDCTFAESSSSDSLQAYFLFTSFYVHGPVLAELRRVVTIRPTTDAIHPFFKQPRIQHVAASEQDSFIEFIILLSKM